MDSLFYTLLARVETLLNANANIIANGVAVHVGRARPLDSAGLPAVGVFFVSDASLGDFGPQNLSFQDWTVVIATEIIVDADATQVNLEQDYLNLRADVHEALMSNAPTMGLTFVMQFWPLGSNEPSLSEEGRRKTASYRAEWAATVRTSVADMTTT